MTLYCVHNSFKIYIFQSNVFENNHIYMVQNSNRRFEVALEILLKEKKSSVLEAVFSVPDNFLNFVITQKLGRVFHFYLFISVLQSF